MDRRNSWGHEDSCCYAIHHFLQLMYSLIHFTRKCFWRLQKGFTTPCQQGIQFFVHAIHIRTDGIFDIFFLPLHGWITIHLPLLMEKTISCFYAVFGNHEVSWWVGKFISWWVFEFWVGKLMSLWVNKLVRWWVDELFRWWVNELKGYALRTYSIGA